jgi:hypothetical protein
MLWVSEMLSASDVFCLLGGNGFNWIILLFNCFREVALKLFFEKLLCNSFCAFLKHLLDLMSLSRKLLLVEIFYFGMDLNFTTLDWGYFCWCSSVLKLMSLHLFDGGVSGYKFFKICLYRRNVLWIYS